jgi:hypothetical protein
MKNEKLILKLKFAFIISLLTIQIVHKSNNILSGYQPCQLVKCRKPTFQEPSWDFDMLHVVCVYSASFNGIHNSVLLDAIKLTDTHAKRKIKI